MILDRYRGKQVLLLEAGCGRADNQVLTELEDRAAPAGMNKKIRRDFQEKDTTEA